MIKYKELREEWIRLRKMRADEKMVIGIKKQQMYGLVIDKITKAAKEAKVEDPKDFDQFTLAAVKSEHKQWLDAKSQGVDCEYEITVLESLLPVALSEEETSGIVIALIARFETPTMKDIMQELKTIEGIDMKIASKWVKELI